ncbi:hypothetical protein A3K73_01050 [Candidatus Pacearchaeota archaeon RBG_13_36_9]|nr:MAG: hypothetical protein A3K73_01050 [Candidatus Pacearchaeota archaeon RBG_13_36_9]
MKRETQILIVAILLVVGILFISNTRFNGETYLTILGFMLLALVVIFKILARKECKLADR